MHLLILQYNSHTSAVKMVKQKQVVPEHSHTQNPYFGTSQQLSCATKYIAFSLCDVQVLQISLQ